MSRKHAFTIPPDLTLQYSGSGIYTGRWRTARSTAQLFINFKSGEQHGENVRAHENLLYPAIKLIRKPDVWAEPQSCSSREAVSTTAQRGSGGEPPPPHTHPPRGALADRCTCQKSSRDLEVLMTAVRDALLWYTRLNLILWLNVSNIGQMWSVL